MWVSSWLPAGSELWQNVLTENSGSGVTMRLIATLASAGILMSLPATAFAQAGSVGGTVGRIDKSISGEAAPSEPHAQVQQRSPAQRQSTAGGCGNILGTWTSGWSSVFGAGDVTINRGGAATHKSGVTGQWSCTEGKVVIVWSHGYTDRLSMSADGKSLTGKNQTGAVISFSR